MGVHVNYSSVTLRRPLRMLQDKIELKKYSSQETKNIVPKRQGCWLTLSPKHSAASQAKGGYSLYFFLAICHKIGLDNKIKTPGCVTKYKSNTTARSALYKSTLKAFNKRLCCGMVLQGVSNKLSVIMVSKSCLFLLCVKLEAKSHSHLQLRGMKCLYLSL